MRAIARLNIGGPARHTVILEHGLRAYGFETLLVHGTPTSDEGSLEELVEEREVRAIRVPGLGRRVHAGGDLLALWHLVRLMYREKPDILHTHTAKAGSLGRLAGVAFNLTRPRTQRCLLVHTFHGHVLSGYFGTFGTQATRFAERVLARFSDRIITISNRQRDEIAHTFRIVSPDKVSVIPLGLELEELLADDLARSHASGGSRVGLRMHSSLAMSDGSFPSKTAQPCWPDSRRSSHNAQTPACSSSVMVSCVHLSKAQLEIFGSTRTSTLQDGDAT